MSRNRMKHSQSLHWMSVVKWILIAGLLSGLGLSYMLCKNQNLHLAAESLRLRNEVDEAVAASAGGDAFDAGAIGGPAGELGFDGPEHTSAPGGEGDDTEGNAQSRFDSTDGGRDAAAIDTLDHATPRARHLDFDQPDLRVHGHIL